MAALYPSVPEPSTDTKALYDATLALKQGYELLIGVRAGGAQAALTPTTINGNVVITNLQSSTNQNSAAIITEANARANADSAAATLITNLTATVNNNQTTNSAAITNEQTVRANADSANATAISNLTATVNNNQTTNSAAITNEQSVRATADSANATSITSVSTTVNGHTSSINSLLTSVNGLVVKYAVTLALNNVTGGYTITGVQRADGTGAIFTMEINSNVIINGNLMVNGSISGAKIGSTTITGGNVAANAITKSYYQTLSSPVAGVSAYQLVLGYTVYVDTTGLSGEALTLSAIFNAGQVYPASGSGTYYAQISFNGTTAQAFGGNAVDGTFTVSDTYQFTGTGGTVGITVYGYWWGQSGQVTLNQRTLVTTVFKR